MPASWDSSLVRAASLPTEFLALQGLPAPSASRPTSSKVPPVEAVTPQSKVSLTGLSHVAGSFAQVASATPHVSRKRAKMSL